MANKKHNTISADSITVAHFRLDERDNCGRMIHQTVYPVSERAALISEAIDLGFDIQFVQAKEQGYNHLLWYSRNGFKQR